MNFDIVKLDLPFVVQTEKTSTNDWVRLNLVDGRQKNVLSKGGRVAELEGAYRALTHLAERVEQALPALIEAQSTVQDTKRARQPVQLFAGFECNWGFDGDGLGGPIGCFIAILAVLFFFLPTLALVLLAIAAGLLGLFLVLLLLGSTIASIESFLDRRSGTLRVLEVELSHLSHLSRLGAPSGLAYLSPRLYARGRSFRAHIVYYAIVANRLIVAPAEEDPVRAAREVGREIGRQQADVQKRDSEFGARAHEAEEALASIQAREAQRQERRGGEGQ